MDTGRQLLSNRIADIIANEGDEALESFAEELEAIMRLEKGRPLADLLVMAALMFPTRAEEIEDCAIEFEVPTDTDLELDLTPPRPTPVRWPMLVRRPAHSKTDPDTGEPFTVPTTYFLTERLDQLAPATSTTPGYDEIDWLTPGEDDVTLVVSMFANETEREAYINGWLQALGCRNGERPGDAVAVDTIGGPACLAWKKDARNLVVWRDVRDPHVNRILSVVEPGGAVWAEADLSYDLLDEFLPLEGLC